MASALRESTKNIYRLVTTIFAVAALIVMLGHHYDHDVSHHLHHKHPDTVAEAANDLSDPEKMIAAIGVPCDPFVINHPIQAVEPTSSPSPSPNRAAISSYTGKVPARAPPGLFPNKTPT